MAGMVISSINTDVEPKASGGLRRRSDDDIKGIEVNTPDKSHPVTNAIGAETFEADSIDHASSTKVANPGIGNDVETQRKKADTDEQHRKLQQQVSGAQSTLKVLDDAMAGGDKDEIQLAIHKAQRMQAAIRPLNNSNTPLQDTSALALPAISLASVITPPVNAANTRNSALSQPVFNLAINSGSAPGPAPAPVSSVVADAAIWERAAKRIGTIRQTYADPYVHAVTVYQEYFSQYSTDVVDVLKTNLNSNNSTTRVTFSKRETVIHAASNLVKKWKANGKSSMIPDKAIWPSFSIPAKKADYPQINTDPNDKNADFCTSTHNSEYLISTLEGAKKWAKEFGLPDSCVQSYEVGSGDNIEKGWAVFVDIEPLEQISKAWSNNERYASKGGDTISFTARQYNDIRNITSSNEARIKSILQSLAQRYNNSNDIYNNLEKVLAAMTRNDLNIDKEYLRF